MTLVRRLLRALRLWLLRHQLAGILTARHEAMRHNLRRREPYLPIDELSAEVRRLQREIRALESAA